MATRATSPGRRPSWLLGRRRLRRGTRIGLITPKSVETGGRVPARLSDYRFRMSLGSHVGCDGRNHREAVGAQALAGRTDRWSLKARGDNDNHADRNS